jgi:hypothetical protein
VNLSVSDAGTPSATAVPSLTKAKINHQTCCAVWCLLQPLDFFLKYQGWILRSKVYQWYRNEINFSRKIILSKKNISF